MNRFLLPLGLFIVLVGFLAIGLTLDPREVPSPLVGKAAPDFTLPQLADPARKFSPAEMKGDAERLGVMVRVVQGRTSAAGGTREERRRVLVRP